ncbi:unnamed protein product [Chrysoparadoxa australica]
MHRSQASSRPLTVLEKRIPRNPKYAKVRSKVNSGMTVDKATYVTARTYLRRRDEQFCRVTPGQMEELFLEYEQDQSEGIIDNKAHRDPDNHGPIIVEHSEGAEPVYDRPYLILDVRTQAEFAVCHITQARSFPMSMLKQDKMTPELLSFKSRDGQLIVLYEEDEKAAIEAANMLVYRGFDNIYLLTGGLACFARTKPSRVEGALDRLHQARVSPRTGRFSTSSRAAASTGMQRGKPPPSSRMAAPTLAFPKGRGATTPSTSRALTSSRLASHTASYRGTPPAVPGSSKSSTAPHQSRTGAGAGAVAAHHSHEAPAFDGGASHASRLSVADTVISRAQSRKGMW